MREDEEKNRLWVVQLSHPKAEDLGKYIEIIVKGEFYEIKFRVQFYKQ